MALTACGGGSDSSLPASDTTGSSGMETTLEAASFYTVGGQLSGLASSETVGLLNSANGNRMSVEANGAFAMSERIRNGANYSITVGRQPLTQTCTVSNGSGKIRWANVTNVKVVCSGGVVTPTTYSVGGNLSGLGTGKSVVLSNNGGDALSLSASGTFTFATRLANAAPYAVTVLTQPVGQTCTVASGSGTINAANVSNVSVGCVDNPVTYSVGGNLSGLGTGKSVVLRNNGVDNLSLSASGTFTFATRLANAATYAVTVLTQPVGQTCAVTNASGTINVANVANVSVACVDNAVPTYSVGGNLSGLGTGKSVVLRNNGGDNLSLSAAGPFAFTTKLANAAAYAVTVLTQPVGQTCTVSNGSGAISSANVSNVAVACVAASVNAWSNFTTTANTLTLTSSEPLKANAPFFGIEVRKNGVDITDSIVNVEALSTTSWRYTFQGQTLNTSGATISISLKNTALASPGHYVAVRGYGAASGVQGSYQMLLDCQNGVGECAGRGARPGLLAAIKGLSNRYSPRDLETSQQGVYDFSEVLSDAAFLATKGKRLNVIFTVKSFGQNTLYSGTGSKVAFDIPRSPSGNGGWDGNRTREVVVYVENSTGVWNTVPFQFNSTRTQVILNSAPPTGTKNVNVVYSRDPFPEHAWQMTPPVAGWYNGAGGQNNDNAASGGSHGFVYAPWRSTTLTWLRNFMSQFQTQWNNAVAAGTVPVDAIESITAQETANALSETDPAYTVAGYRAGLFEFAKYSARAARRKALIGQMFNIIPQGNRDEAMAGLSSDIILWGARLEGSDLFNDEPALDNNVYQNVHRAFNDKALTMIWQQNASYAENIGTSTTNFYTPAQQFIKAQRGVGDYSTPGGMRGLQAEYVFWNMTTDAPKNSPQTFLDALPVIANNPIIQTSGNDHYRWRRAVNATPIGDQEIIRVNP